MVGNNTTLDSSNPENIRVDHLLSKMKDIIPPFAEANKFGGSKFTPSNKDYGNFPDSKRIDEILSNMRQIRQY